MGTPSEVLAAEILERIFQPEELKYVDRSYDFEGRKMGQRLIFEVKSRALTPAQMRELPKEQDRGADVYLIHVNPNGDYLLFKLVMSNTLENKKEVDEEVTIRVNITPETPSGILFLVKSHLQLHRNLINIKTKKSKVKDLHSLMNFKVRGRIS